MMIMMCRLESKENYYELAHEGTMLGTAVFRRAGNS